MGIEVGLETGVGLEIGVRGVRVGLDIAVGFGVSFVWDDGVGVEDAAWVVVGGMGVEPAPAADGAGEAAAAGFSASAVT